MPKDLLNLHRIAVVKEVFASLFVDRVESFQEAQAESIIYKKTEIDTIISQIASKYSGDKLAKIDAAILYLAVWELIYDDSKIPYKFVINEAVELAKELGSETSPGFVNAVLGKVYDIYFDKNAS